ncbi:heat repeat-containing protein 6 [Lichtheimia corymbifera JMRC:FSU:9682]|uniref:Heat repeat-containing protein 6 n=1 Tax=Lichtheimia corymbifera JMRC:FSU:9682 TaxID=1263082 RepID=A0A068RL38_9FUNG|nr:heat repeat-containing protein 6 [Lichtheimia corymbifera JMRC:FSU:9682]
MQPFYTLVLQYYQHALDSTHTPNNLVSILNELNNVEMPVKNVPDQQVVDILVTGSKSIQPNDDSFSPFCKFLFRQCSKQIRLSSLRASQFEACIVLLLDALENSDTSSDLRVDVLRALSALVFENASNTVKFYPRIANILCKLADRSVQPLEVRRMAINCIANTCAGAGSKLQSYYKDYYQVLLANICTVEHGSHGTIMVASSTLDFSDSATRKIASSTLRALQFVLSQDKSLVTNPLCDIIQIIYTFIFMSVSLQTYSMANRDEPTPSTSTSRPMQVRLRLQKQQPAHRAQLSWRPTEFKSMGLTSSDSELSDSNEAAMGNPRKQRDDAKIRINALLCLAAIAKTSPRALQPYWHKFLSDTFSIFLTNNSDQDGKLLPVLRSDNQPYSLFTILLYDPMITVRTAVCNALIAMLDGSKQYLGVASERDTKSSFTSLSQQLASILRDFHSAVIHALSKEEHPQVTALIFKLACTLVNNCPYDRLAPGYLKRLYNAALLKWPQASATLRTAILHLVIAILETGSQEGAHMLEESVEESMPPLIDLVPQLTLPDGSSEASLELVSAAWMTLGTLAKHQFDMIFDREDVIHERFEAAMEHKEEKVRIAAMTFAESYGCAMGNHIEEDNSSRMAKYLAWWTGMLSKHIQASCIDDAAGVRAMSCDCLASIPKAVYEQLPHMYQTLAVALLLSLPSDQDISVRAAACRALGVFVLFPSLRGDPHFVSDMAAAIMDQMNDKAILVRVRASWAEGNLGDALVAESEDPEFDFQEWIPLMTWSNIIITATSACTDNDKLRSNAVRALGSILRITSKDYFHARKSAQLLKNAMNGLCKNIETGTLKTRWNACHAASNMLKNPDFPVGDPYPWTKAIYTALIHSLLQCRNFKVRINACLALATPTRRDQYGSSFDAVVQAILAAWDACHQEDDTFQEYRYREQLKEQVKSALHHIQTLSSVATT